MRKWKTAQNEDRCQSIVISIVRGVQTGKQPLPEFLARVRDNVTTAPKTRFLGHQNSIAGRPSHRLNQVDGVMSLPGLSPASDRDDQP